MELNEGVYLFKRERLMKMIVFLWLLGATVISFAESSQMQVLELSYRSAEEIKFVLMPLIDPEETVVTSGYQLIVRASPARIEEIKRLIAQLDTPLQNLQITVIQGQNISAAEMNAQVSIRMPVPIKHTTHRPVGAQARFYQTQKQTLNQSTQMLKALEGQAAYIKVGQTRPLQNVTVYDNSYGPAVIVDSTVLVEASTGFEVIPRLSGDTVVLEVLPWSEQWQNQDELSTQSAATVIRARLGEWVELGAVQQSGQEQQQGRFSRQTLKVNQDLRILVKVDKVAH